VAGGGCDASTADVLVAVVRVGDEDLAGCRAGDVEDSSEPEALRREVISTMTVVASLAAYLAHQVIGADKVRNGQAGAERMLPGKVSCRTRP
jgi:hypothetical protein